LLNIANQSSIFTTSESHKLTNLEFLNVDLEYLAVEVLMIGKLGKEVTCECAETE
jgi:hypothetical protein